MIRYCITDRSLRHVVRHAQSGVDYFQIRDKELSGHELFRLTGYALTLIAETPAKLLVNDRTDIALAAGAHGVHLRSRCIAPASIRRIVPEGFVIGISCHDTDEIDEAAGADFVVYGPVFASPGKGPPTGLDGLARAARHTAIPVIALGGIDHENARSCIEAGAAGIAAIRMFQQ